MEKHVRLFLKSTLFFLALGLSVRVNAQPEVITEVPVNSTGFVTVGDLVYFLSGNELWRTDGTDTGTIPLKSGLIQPGSFTEFNGAAYFTNDDNSELWMSDGTPSGTMLLHNSGDNSLSILGHTNGNLFFEAFDAATGRELYRTDGTVGGTIILKDIAPGPANSLRGPSGLVLGNHLIFSADNGTNGTELWTSDGSPGGTVMIRDINPGPEHSVVLGTGSFVYNNLFYFMAITDGLGAEPWVSDGTAEGTHLLKDISVGAAPTRNVQFAIGNNGYLYFLLLDDYNAGPASLWKTAGTEASTSFIKVIGEGTFDNNLYSFRVYQNKVYFWSHMDSYTDLLWVTDGTSEGTQEIFSVDTPEGSIHYFDVVNNHLLFTGSAQTFPIPFYRSDGTAAGTKAFRNFNVFTMPGDIIERIGVTTAGDFAFFADHDGPTGGELPENPEDYFHLFQTDGFTTESMRTMYGVSTVGADNITDFNGKVIFTTYDDEYGGTDEPKQLWIYDPATSGSRATFTLVNADTDEDIQTITEGDVIKKSASTNVNIRFNPVETPGSVVFSINGDRARTETAPPFSLAGDTNGDYFTWEGAVPGSYTLTATPYSESGGQGTAGTPHTVSFTIEEETPSEPCTASGTILREYWEGVSGSKVADIPLHTSPTGTSHLSSFEGPTNSGSNYGARVSGYICPPASGNFSFWIASNDHSELWLSTDENPSNKVRIAFVNGATDPREWDKFASQQSGPIELVAGKSYYIEALHKQGVGTDHLAVGWQLPDGTMERPISGSRLSPSEGGGNAIPVVTIENPTDGQTFQSPTTQSLNAIASDSDGSIVKVEFFANSEKIGEDLTAFDGNQYNYVWENIPPGTHTLTVTATDNAGGVGTSAPVTVTVTGVACSATGFITRDYWANVPGSRVSDIPINTTPTSTSEINIFEGPSNIGTNYASRIRGYICPPITGNYTFWIASNDHSQLWLNPLGDDPAGRRRIAFVEGATSPQEWTKFASQRSEPIMLEQGKRYYIEALHKQGMGTDHIAVGWMLPNFKSEKPIPGHHLSPFDMNQAARLASATEEAASEDKTMYSEINIYPNPVPTGKAELKISGYEGIDEVIETQVEIINLTGEVVYKERIRCGGDCNAYLMNMNEQLLPGVYMVNMRTNGSLFSKRLLVK